MIRYLNYTLNLIIIFNYSLLHLISSYLNLSTADKINFKGKTSKATSKLHKKKRVEYSTKLL